MHPQFRKGWPSPTTNEVTLFPLSTRQGTHQDFVAKCHDFLEAVPVMEMLTECTLKVSMIVGKSGIGIHIQYCLGVLERYVGCVPILLSS